MLKKSYAETKVTYLTLVKIKIKKSISYIILFLVYDIIHHKVFITVY